MSLKDEKDQTDEYVCNTGGNNKEEESSDSELLVPAKTPLKQEEFLLNAEVLLKRKEILEEVRKSQAFKNVCYVV
jgi:hypothetical protein